MQLNQLITSIYWLIEIKKQKNSNDWCWKVYFESINVKIKTISKVLRFHHINWDNLLNL